MKNHRKLTLGAALMATAIPVISGMALQDAGAQAGIEFLRIAAGTFQMGCSTGDLDCRDNEKPVHSVRISNEFELGKYEVTQAQWQAVMGSNPSHFKGDARPVEFVSWSDAQEFIKKLNEKNDGYRYRLPTEAEWEYAARAGTMHEGLLETAWHQGSSRAQTHPVGKSKPNAWGLYDMLGNVGELVEDSYDDLFYNGGAMTDPKGPSAGPYKVLRGSSWRGKPSTVRVSYRGVVSTSNRDSDSGFRLVRVRS